MNREGGADQAGTGRREGTRVSRMEQRRWEKTGRMEPEPEVEKINWSSSLGSREWVLYKFQRPGICQN